MPTSRSVFDDVREPAALHHRHVEPDAVARVELALDGERDLVARRQLVDEPLAGAVVEQRALAADRLGDQEAVVLAAGRERGGVELDQLHVGERRAGGVRERHPGADRAARVRGALPQRGRAAGGQHRRARDHRAAARAPAGRARTPMQRPSSVQIDAGGRALEHLDPVVRAPRAPTARA